MLIALLKNKQLILLLSCVLYTEPPFVSLLVEIVTKKYA